MVADVAAGFDAELFLKTLTHRPGVYRMLDSAGEVLYVGKARDLKRRVASYFGSKAHHPKTQALMAQAARVDVTVTTTEQEALLLEYNLIKAHKPRFNVVLRDDKSYPYIYVSTHQPFPRFEFHRGARKGPGRYLGPYPSAGAVRQVLAQLQKLFQVRQCRDSFFANRTRPCLQHQIRRCTAPCVGLVDPAAYRRDVDDAIRFLEGRDDAVLTDLVERMERAAAALDYEQAARHRDQIGAIKDVQSSQAISGARTRDADVLGAHAEAGQACIALIMIRGGRVLGSRTYFPRVAGGPEAAELIEGFVVQHYFEQPPPAEILVTAEPDDRDLLEQTLGERAGHTVAIRSRVRGTRRRWLEMALENAREGLRARRAAGAGLRAQLDALAQTLQLPETPERIECFDISHTGGGETVGSCVVWGPDGALKSAYRRYNVRGAEAGDDYGAMAEVLGRRFARSRRGEAPVPDLLLIDGGRGQVNAAIRVLAEYQYDDLPVVGVAKGPGRKPGRERLYRAGDPEAIALAADSPALHLVQQIRDEAHRFAITGHRTRRGRQRHGSTLEEIAGLGPRRRQLLLQHFGGLQGLRKAGAADIGRVKGIGQDLAQRIYDHFHGGPRD